MSEPGTQDRRRFVAVAAGKTDTGRQRKHNEDHVLVKADLGLFVVADGMGGHNAGDVASALATASLHNYFAATVSGTLPGEPAEDEADLPGPARRLVAGVRKANRDVFEISTTMQQHSGMGSTIVAVHVSPTTRKIHIGHVGDSRCYRLRDGEIELLTRDHSLVNDALALKPDLTEGELARLPRNIITRALGMKDVVKVDLRTEDLRTGDVYLLCSDGLSGMVQDDQILEVSGITEELGELCDLLIAMANDAGGTDNITALAVRVDSVLDPPAPEIDVATADVRMPKLDGIVAEETLDLLHSGAEIDISSSRPPAAVPIAHCPRCDHELIVGNLFCVECGFRVPALQE